MSSQITYRNFEINPSCGWGFIWSHVEYTGPEDRRCGAGPTPNDCKDEIDEFIESNPDFFGCEVTQ